ncbi:MAG: Nitrile hydratase beta subunit, partial [uncultured Pseudonocardia sp.]
VTGQRRGRAVRVRPGRGGAGRAAVPGRLGGAGLRPQRRDAAAGRLRPRRVPRRDRADAARAVPRGVVLRAVAARRRDAHRGRRRRAV